MRLALALLATAGAGGGEAPAPPAAFDVPAGPLTARIERSGFGVSLVDRRRRPVLRTAGLQIRIRPGDGWTPTGGLVSVVPRGRGREIDLRTPAAAVPRVRVLVTPTRHDAVALRVRVPGRPNGVDGIRLSFAARAGEGFLGLGERPERVDHRGREEVEGYVSDGPYQPADRALVSAVIPPAGLRPRDDATYFPLPWVLSTRGHGVLADTGFTTYHSFGRRTWSVEVARAPRGVTAPAGARGPRGLALRVFPGSRPAAALRRFSRAVGRQPAPPGPWVFGPWYQPGGPGREPADQVARLHRRDAPVSVAQTYLHYLPCGDQVGRRAAERAAVRRLHALGVAVTTYVNPMLCTGYPGRYAEARRAGALLRDRAGRPLTYRYSTDDSFVVSQFDFSSPRAVRVFGSIVGEAVRDGFDGWMEDFGEYTPLAGRTADGRDGTEAHNAHPTEYHCGAAAATRRAARPLARFVRSGWTGTAACAPVVWSGDPTTSLGYDGLSSQVRAGLSAGLSGVSRWGSDIGGFFALLGERLDGEELRRWVQFGAVSGVMRTQRNGIDIPDQPRPQVDDPDQLAHWRRWTKLRTQLLPYVAAADATYRRTGLPVMRHLALVAPRDGRAVRREDEFLFGGDLLAAPVLEAGARRREVYLPAGTWVDLWRSARYVERTGGLRLGRARVLGGRRSVVLPAPLDELPLLARAGALLPLLPPEIDSLAPYARGARGVVGLGAARGRLDLLAFPRGRSRAVLVDGRLESREGRGRWTLAVRGRTERRLRLQAALGTLRGRWRPCRVALDGRPLPRSAWSWQGRARVLRTSFTTRSGTLSVTRACR